MDDSATRTSAQNLSERLHRQRLTAGFPGDAAQLVAWLGAVQSQDFPMALWGLACRLDPARAAGLAADFNAGRFLRTHVLRPTLHFVTPHDIRWMLELTSTRVQANFAANDRRHELTPAVFAKTNAILAEALAGHHYLTRAECDRLFEAAGLSLATTQRIGSKSSHIMAHAELTGLVCSGPLRGRQHTYALLDERAPDSLSLTRTEALAELAQRYLQARAPATLADFAWWSGLTRSEIRPAYEAALATLDPIPPPPLDQTVFLLPNYDEYLVAYADRSMVARDVPPERLDGRGNVLFQHTIIMAGRVAGTWKRPAKLGADPELNLFTPPSAQQRPALDTATADYRAFAGTYDATVV